MKVGIHSSSWLDSHDPTEVLEAMKARALWAEIKALSGSRRGVVRKLAVLRGHWDAAARDCEKIEKTLVQLRLLARSDARVAAKHERLATHGPLRGFAGTVSEVIDLIGQY